MDMIKHKSLGLDWYQYSVSVYGPIPVVSVSPILQPIPEPIPVGRHAFVMTANAVCWLFTESRKRSYIDGGVGAKRRDRSTSLP